MFVWRFSLAKKKGHARAPPVFVRVARLPPSAPSTTSLLHIGHVLWPASHRSTQVLWNSWPHGKRRSVSPASAEAMAEAEEEIPVAPLGHHLGELLGREDLAAPHQPPLSEAQAATATLSEVSESGHSRAGFERARAAVDAFECNRYSAVYR